MLLRQLTFSKPLKEQGIVNGSNVEVQIRVKGGAPDLTESGIIVYLN